MADSENNCGNDYEPARGATTMRDCEAAGSARTIGNLKKNPPDMEYAIDQVRHLEGIVQRIEERINRRLTIHTIARTSMLHFLIYTTPVAALWMSWLTWMVLR